MKTRSATLVQLVPVNLHALLPGASMTAENAEIGRVIAPLGMQPRHRLTTAGNNDLFAGLHGIQQGAQVGFGFGNTDDLHNGLQMVI